MSSSFPHSVETPHKEKTTIAPYGSWKSPITADIVSGASKRLGGTAVDSSGRLVWLESRPNESGEKKENIMSTLSRNGNERLRTVWTPEMDQYFIELMLEQVKKGNRLDDLLFSKRAWKLMSSSFTAKFKFPYGKDVLKNRHKTLRNLFKSAKNLLKKDGFSWDETKQMLVADKRWLAVAHHVPVTGGILSLTALLHANRWISDSRDEHTKERLEAVDLI